MYGGGLGVIPIMPFMPSHYAHKASVEVGGKIKKLHGLISRRGSVEMQGKKINPFWQALAAAIGLPKRILVNLFTASTKTERI